MSIIDTYAVYLDAINYPGGENPTADSSMFTIQTFWLDTKTSEDDEVVTGHSAARPICKIWSFLHGKSPLSANGRCAVSTVAAMDAPITALRISTRKGIRYQILPLMYVAVASVTAVNDLALAGRP